MEDWDMNLEPPEPYKVVGEMRQVECTNEDCVMFDTPVLGEVEVEYWPHDRTAYSWACIWCDKTIDVEDQ
jgi:aspartate carbamoyltransferase regulatory subunit